MAFTFFNDNGGGPYTDVLIIGAGSAGLMSANLLSRYGINTRIIEKKPLRERAGRADCIQSRTLEVLESMGLRDELEKKGCKIREYTFWCRDTHTGSLDRTNIGPDVVSPTPYPWTLSVDKGDLADVLEEDLKSRGRNVEYNKELLLFSKPHSGERMTVHVKNHNSGAIETWYTSFILGADGANSLVRETLGIESDTFDTLNFWAVADVSATTDLPDYRRRCTIRSSQGNCILTPKNSSGFRVRTLLSTEDLSNPHWNMAHVTGQSAPLKHVASSMGLVSAIQTRISSALSPYKFLISDVAWVSQYSMRKSLATHFGDASNSVFLLGSACHTHSPMTKQSMNGGMMDAVNLTWKLALVIKGHSTRTILSSYETERRTLLVKALEFDSNIDQILALRTDDAKAISGMGFHNFEEASGYMSGCGARYPASYLVKEERRVWMRKAIEPLTPGKRLLPAKLTRHLDGNEVDLLHILGLSGRFTLIYFVGDIVFAPVLQGLSNFLRSSESPLEIGLDSTEDNAPLVDIVMIHTVAHTTFAISELCLPWREHSMNILEDVGAQYHIDIGINPGLGGLCFVRPDGYIAIVSNLDNTSAITEYLRRLSPPRRDSTDSETVIGLTEPKSMST